MRRINLRLAMRPTNLRLAMRPTNLRLAIRQLIKTRGFTVLNILGLTLGLTTFLLIVLFIANECSYDRWNANADRIYRVNTDLNLNQHISYMADAAPPVAPTLLKNYPQVEQAVRLLPQPGMRFKQAGHLIAEPHVVICDPHIFAVFTLPMVAGNPATALQNPCSPAPIRLFSCPPSAPSMC